MNQLSRFLTLSLTLALCFVLYGCSNVSGSTSILEYSFTPDNPSDYENIKTIYINEDFSEIFINADLEMRAGEVSVQVINIANSKTEWSGKYRDNAAFTIELSDIKADTELALIVRATQTDKMKLSLYTDTKLAKNPESPMKPEPRRGRF